MYLGLGHGCLTELTEVPGWGIKPSHSSQKFWVLWPGRTELTEVSGRYTNGVPVPPVLWFGRTELTDLPGTDMKVAQNSQKFRVFTV